MASFPGTERDDVLRGTREDDTIAGKGGNDTLYGDAGNDHLIGGEGADHLDGGADFDDASYDDSPVGVAVNLSKGQGYFGTAEGDTLVSIERVNGSAHADLLIGSDQDDTLVDLSTAIIVFELRDKNSLRVLLSARTADSSITPMRRSG